MYVCIVFSFFGLLKLCLLYLKLEKWYKCHFSWWNGSWKNCSVSINAWFSTGIGINYLFGYKCPCNVINISISVPHAERPANPWSFSCSCAIVYIIKLGQRIQEVASWYEYNCICWYSCKSRGETSRYEFLVYMQMKLWNLFCSTFNSINVNKHGINLMFSDLHADGVICNRSL